MRKRSAASSPTAGCSWNAIEPQGNPPSGPFGSRGSKANCFGTAGRPEPLVEALRPFIGQWVAVRGDEVLVAAASAKEVVAWLARHGRRAQAMFRVPGSEQAITGAAPQ